MDFEVNVCSGCQLAHVRLEGVVTGRALYEVLYTFMKNDRWSLSQHDIWDLRAARDLFIRPNEAAMLADRLPQGDEDPAVGLTAFVTRTTTQTAYGIVLFQSIHPWTRLRRSFHSEERAVRWLVDQPRAGFRQGEDVTDCDAGCLLGDRGTIGSE